MVNKKNVNPLGVPPDDGSFSFIQPEFEAIYDSYIDSSFAALGRIIVLHLTPEKTIDVSGIQASTPAVQFNPFMGRAPRPVPSQISTVRTTGTKIVYRDVEYVAHIKHGPKNDDATGGILLEKDEVITTTVVESRPHIEECQSVTIDGRRYQLEWIRPIGFQNVRYIMSKWSQVNESENG